MVFLSLLLVASLSAQEVPTASPGVSLPLEGRSQVQQRPGLLPPQTPITEVDEDQRPEAASADSQSTTNVRSFNLRVGETLSVFFDGEGWIYDNAVAELGNPVRERTAAGTRFRFQPRLAGQFELIFQRQDPVAGKILHQRVKINVQDSNSTVESKTTNSPPVGVSANGALLQTARRLYSLGRFLELYRMLGDQSALTEAPLVEIKAQAAEELGRFQEAMELWRRSIDVASEQEKQAVLVKALLAASRHGDGPRLAQFWSLYEAAYANQRPSNLSEDEYWHLSRSISEKVPSLLPTVLGLWEAWYPDGRGKDVWHYLMARWSEQEKRDYQEALRHYSLLARNFPLSPHRQMALERSANLRQQLFLIR